MQQKFRYKGLIFMAFVLLMAGSVTADSIDALLKSIFLVPAPTGNENLMAEKIREYLPNQSDYFQDNLGSLYYSQKKGGVKLTVVTGMDEFGYFVSGITADGYLRLDRGVSPPHALFDAFHHGHPMIVLSESGSLSGVLALPSSHILSRERRQDLLSELTLDNAYLDIGAGSRIEVEKRGVAFLDPITPKTEIHALAEGKISGYSLGSKTCTAVLLDIVLFVTQESQESDVMMVWLAQAKKSSRGRSETAALGAVRAAKEIKAEQILVLDVYACGSSSQDEVDVGKGPVLVGKGLENSSFGLDIIRMAKEKRINLQYSTEYQSAVMNPFLGGHSEAAGLFLPVRFASTASEVVDMADVNALQQLLQSLASAGGSR